MTTVIMAEKFIKSHSIIIFHAVYRHGLNKKLGNNQRTNNYCTPTTPLYDIVDRLLGRALQSYSKRQLVQLVLTGSESSCLLVLVIV